MLRTVQLEDDLLQIVNTRIPLLHEDPFRYAILVVLVGLSSVAGFAGFLIYRLASADNPGSEWEEIKSSLRRAFTSTLVVRLSLLSATLVIPLIFYVNNKEHYWTAKHSAMLLTAAVGLGAWMVVRSGVPRFRTPYIWPVSLILASAAFSTLQAVNIAESIGMLFAIFGSAALFFLASQVFTTSKRIHLFVVIFVSAAAIVSIYGLSQAYLLLPMEHVYAQDTRAPVSTIGNKNYAAYVLDLSIPLTLALAAMRRSPAQTLLALAAYFLCRWHFSICDTRGGTIAMSIGVMATILIVAVYHGRRFRLLLYAVVLEPLLWAATSVGGLTYADAQGWGKELSGSSGKRAIAAALNRAASEGPEELRGYTSYVRGWFDKGLESYLGADFLLFALVGGFGLGLFLFWAIQRYSRNWTAHLAAAGLTAFIPYLLALSVIPGPAPSQVVAGRVLDHLARSGMDSKQREVAVEILGRFAKPMAEAANRYIETYTAMQRNVAAMFSLALFTTCATFLLFRWYDREKGWLPGFATVAGLGVWLLLSLSLRSGGSLPRRLIGGLFSRLDHAWPIDLSGLHANGSLLGLPVTVFCFALFSLGSLFILIAAMQYIPAHFTREETAQMARRAGAVGRIAIPAVILVVFVALWFTPRIGQVGEEFVSTLRAGGKGSVVRAFFNGGHAFFNTRARYEGRPSDGAIGFRLEIYQGCLRKVRDSPIFGIGPGNFKVIHPHPKYETSLERRILGKEVLGRKAHNDFLEDLVENGMFGFLGLVWMFTAAGALLYRSLRLIREPKTSTDVFNNTITWGFAWALLAILVHAQFEAPLLQPASTYPTWMMFGIVFQLHRIKRRRLTVVEGIDVGGPTVRVPQALDPLSAGSPLPPAAYELPSRAPSTGAASRRWNPWVAWTLAVAVVTVLTGTVFMRQFVGEMWLRWGMLFSDAGIEKFDYTFQSMEKASEVYPEQMEINYILGRYCIDAVQKVFPVWSTRLRPEAYSQEALAKNAETLSRLRMQNQLDPDRILEYAQLGVDVHKRDIYMNPHYKWAHNNMGVLYDKMSEIYSEMAFAEQDPEKKREYEERVAYYSAESKNCYRKALEIDALQIYALFNLGVGALREGRMARAEKYFERTLLADPRRGDVNYFLARCRFAQSDEEGAIESARELFAWSDRHSRNTIQPHEKREIEAILGRIARSGLAEGRLETAKKAAEILVERYDRCLYLALLSLAVIAEGNAAKGLALANECINTCEEPIFAEAVFAHAKANCVLGATQAALDSLESLMNSVARDSFRPTILEDPAFGPIEGTARYRSLMGIAPASGSASSEEVLSASP